MLIHIGKCGGASLRKAVLDSKKVKITGVVHTRKPYYFKGQNYYIVVRDPVARCISAFNWRYKIVVDDANQRTRFKGEYESLIKYKSFNELAEALYDDRGVLDKEASKDFENIHHLRERISFYLEDFLKICNPNDIKDIFVQESLNEDIERILGVSFDDKERKNNNNSYEKKITDKAEINLKKYIIKDYECLEYLNTLNKFKKYAIKY
ncbi:MAG: hypothetical protein ABJN96_16485 [Marinomonas sp.]